MSKIDELEQKYTECVNSNEFFQYKNRIFYKDLNLFWFISLIVFILAFFVDFLFVLLFSVAWIVFLIDSNQEKKLKA